MGGNGCQYFSSFFLSLFPLLTHTRTALFYHTSHPRSPLLPPCKGVRYYHRVYFALDLFIHFLISFASLTFWEKSRAAAAAQLQLLTTAVYHRKKPDKKNTRTSLGVLIEPCCFLFRCFSSQPSARTTLDYSMTTASWISVILIRYGAAIFSFFLPSFAGVKTHRYERVEWDILLTAGFDTSYRLHASAGILKIRIIKKLPWLYPAATVASRLGPDPMSTGLSFCLFVFLWMQCYSM